MRHLTKREMQKLEPITADTIDLQYDWPRRLRNALNALTQLDPHPIDWLEKNTNPRMGIQRVTRLVEIRARALLLRRHNFFGHQEIGHLIFRDTWMFTDQGNLSPG